ncbi:hypothetical protein [Actinomadura sp. 7K507]|uniref:hypothetical protein n=1 Tax=Actinomadura sp. 7K507 TaxID=2530365 RepID=UPI001A9E14CA|nr:hypothetical protein [Actinomadura sp. 7K507]
MTPIQRPTTFSTDLAERVTDMVTVAAAQRDVRGAVEANHDDNRWWPTFVTDPRIRMLVAGWSSRVSYTMIDTYAAVVKAADSHGWDQLTAMDDTRITTVVRSIGLTETRIGYLHSLRRFLDERGLDEALRRPAAEFINDFADNVTGASYKIAQCAALYSRGYHCGIIPVDSGMVDLLAPTLGIRLEKVPHAHERMRGLLEACATRHAPRYRALITQHGYAVTLPEQAEPTWWLHLVLIYFKRLYLNKPTSVRLCTRRPVCPDLLDCRHTGPIP